MAQMSSLNEKTNIIRCNILNFIAESVNIYNWHLLRNPNPLFIMYDVTSQTKNDLFNTILYNENKIYMINILKVTLKTLHIITDIDGYDFGTMAAFFASYIQDRQKKLQETGQYIEVETLLNYNIDSVSNFKPDLYLELYEIEKHNINLNLNYDITTRRDLYNNIDYSSYNEVFNSIKYSKPSVEDDDEEDFDEIELELLYYDHDEPTITIRQKHTKVDSFECPICYETQQSSDFCVTLKCLHKYCKKCFHNIINSQITLCAMCRRPITECEENEII